MPQWRQTSLILQACRKTSEIFRNHKEKKNHSSGPVMGSLSVIFHKGQKFSSNFQLCTYLLLYQHSHNPDNILTSKILTAKPRQPHSRLLKPTSFSFPTEQGFSHPYDHARILLCSYCHLNSFVTGDKKPQTISSSAAPQPRVQTTPSNNTSSNATHYNGELELSYTVRSFSSLMRSILRLSSVFSCSVSTSSCVTSFSSSFCSSSRRFVICSFCSCFCNLA